MHPAKCTRYGSCSSMPIRANLSSFATGSEPIQGGLIVAFAMDQERVNVGRMERWISMVAGGVLAAYGLKRREVPGGAAALAGAALLYRGATGHCDLYQAIGV